MQNDFSVQSDDISVQSDDISVQSDQEDLGKDYSACTLYSSLIIILINISTTLFFILFDSV